VAIIVLRGGTSAVFITDFLPSVYNAGSIEEEGRIVSEAVSVKILISTKNFNENKNNCYHLHYLPCLCPRPSRPVPDSKNVQSISFPLLPSSIAPQSTPMSSMSEQEIYLALNSTEE
jgi:hypothetical protein